MFGEKQTGSLIGFFRDASWTLRTIASVVILTFGGLVTSPAVAAVKQEAQQIQWHKVDDTNVAKLSAKVQDAHKFLAKLVSHDPKSLDMSASKAEIHSLKSDLENLDKGAMDDFAATEAHIQAHHLPAVIEQRQEEAVKTYRSRMDTLLGELKGAEDAKDTTTFLTHVNNAKAHLDKVQPKPFHEKFDPNHLPFSVAKPTTVKPRLNKQDYDARPVVPPKRIQVASIGPLTGIVSAAALAASVPTNPSDPSYLAPTDDVQITDAIKAKAAELHNNPVEIYNWVHNNIEYIPTYGSIQGSDMTLQTLKGNDFDQASLLIALLRAANIPARYVYGTVRVPIAQVENWVGGVTDPNAAMNLMAQGGIPVSGVTQGGAIKYAQFEHVWVEAWVNFVPSHAAKLGPGNTWMPMDASFKQYSPLTFSNPSDFVPAPATSIGALAAAGVQTNSGTTTVTGINYLGVMDVIANYQDAVQQAIAANPSLTINALIPARSIVQTTYPHLASSLPYLVSARGQAFTAVPSNFEYSVKVEMFGTQTDQSLDNPSASVSIKLSTIGTKRLSIDYLPASAADEATLNSLLVDTTTTKLPVYLINEYPVISLDGQALGQASPVTMGTQQYVTVSIQEPGDSISANYVITAGDETVVGVDGDGITNSAIATRAQSVDTSTAAENLQQVSLTYWMLQDTLMEYLAQQQHLGSRRAPSTGLFSSPLIVSYMFGVPHSGYYHGRQMDVKSNRIGVSGGTTSDRLAYTQTIGLLGSYLEGATFDMVMGYGTGWSVSSVQYLLSANNANMPIYAITPANTSAVLPLLSVTNDVSTDISNALNAGLHVVTHQAPVAGGGSGELGQGYIMYDPTTGAGAYQVSTGLSGGASQDCGAPQKTPIQQAIQNLLLAVVLASALTLLIMSGGLLAGGLAAAGAASESLSFVLSALGITGVAFATTANAGGNAACMGTIRVQLQSGSANILSQPAVNSDPPGVLTIQVVNSLEWIWVSRVTVRNLFPVSYDSWLRSAIDSAEAQIVTIPQSGGWVGQSGGQIRKTSPDGLYRVDIENLRGYNLRE